MGQCRVSELTKWRGAGGAREPETRARGGQVKVGFQENVGQRQERHKAGGWGVGRNVRWGHGGSEPHAVKRARTLYKRPRAQSGENQAALSAPHENESAECRPPNRCNKLEASSWHTWVQQAAVWCRQQGTAELTVSAPAAQKLVPGMRNVGIWGAMT